MEKREERIAKEVSVEKRLRKYECRERGREKEDRG